MIDPITGSWDTELLDQTFWEEDAAVIKSIPTHLDMDDVMAWHFDTRGVFSVRSAYKVHRENMWLEGNRSASSSNSVGSNEEAFWKKLWKLTLLREDQAFFVADEPQQFGDENEPSSARDGS